MNNPDIFNYAVLLIYTLATKQQQDTQQRLCRVCGLVCNKQSPHNCETLIRRDWHHRVVLAHPITV